MSDPVIATPAPVLIENRLRRPPAGTKVDIGGHEYHFKPSADGREFCLVSDQAHLARFLAIPEAYVMIGVVQAPAAAPVGAAPVLAPIQEPPALETVLASVLTPRDPADPVEPAQTDDADDADEGGTVTIESFTITPGEAETVVEGQTPPPTPHPLDHDGDGKPGGSLPQAETIPQDLAALTIEELREVFAKEIGRTANARAKPETLIAQIVAYREETGTAK